MTLAGPRSSANGSSLPAAITGEWSPLRGGAAQARLGHLPRSPALRGGPARFPEVVDELFYSTRMIDLREGHERPSLPQPVTSGWSRIGVESEAETRQALSAFSRARRTRTGS